MPDISMCANDECPMAKKCYRHEAKPNEYLQSWTHFKPTSDTRCDHFMEIWIKPNDQ